MKNLILFVLIILSNISFSQNCEFSKKKYDEFKGDSIIVTKSELFLGHTDSTIKKYFKKGDYIVFNVYTAKIGAIYALYFNVVVQTENAYKYYGSIRE